MNNYEIISHNEALPAYFNCYTDRNQFIPVHWHHHIEILYIVSGKMDLQINGTTYVLEEKDMFVVNSGNIHQTIVSELSTVILLQIPYNMVIQSLPKCESILFHEYYPYSSYKNNDAFIEITKNLRVMNDIIKKKDLGYIFRFNSLLQNQLYNLIVDFSEETVKANSKLKHLTRLKKAVDYINSNYKEPISVIEISNHVSLNPEYFCRFFKKNMGYTFLEYLNQVRITYIYKDLVNTSDSITEIITRYGFTNYKVFSRMFKETYGATPSKIREAL